MSAALLKWGPVAFQVATHVLYKYLIVYTSVKTDLGMLY